MTTEKTAFEGGVAVITGAGSGIGEALALRAAQIGMKVVLADIAEERLEARVVELRLIGKQALV